MIGPIGASKIIIGKIRTLQRLTSAFDRDSNTKLFATPPISAFTSDPKSIGSSRLVLKRNENRAIITLKARSRFVRAEWRTFYVRFIFFGSSPFTSSDGTTNRLSAELIYVFLEFLYFACSFCRFMPLSRDFHSVSTCPGLAQFRSISLLSCEADYCTQKMKKIVKQNRLTI